MTHRYRCLICLPLERNVALTAFGQKMGLRGVRFLNYRNYIDYNYVVGICNENVIICWNTKLRI